jgi:hypothetical protein
VNVESEVGEPTNLAMLELMSRSQTPSTIGERIKYLSKVLDGNPVACGSGIGRRPDIVFRVSFNTAIMSLVQILKTKQWCTHKLSSHFMHLKLTLHKLINEKLCVFLMYMYSWDTII